MKCMALNASPKQLLINRQSAPPPPAPIVVPPSQDWDGNNGPWSSFWLGVGTPAQNVKFLPSTSIFQTWVVAPEGCTSIDPPGCASSRGNLFNSSASTSWTQSRPISASTFQRNIDRNLGYSGNGVYGRDTVALGWQGNGGPSLDQQTVVSITTKEFYLGIFGLDPRPSNLTNSRRPVPSYMMNLFDQSMIPSITWGYTAGNRYRSGGFLGALTLGGYDASRFISNSVTFPFNQVDDRVFTVTIQSITFASHDNSSRLLDTGSAIIALVDSTAPYIYLPVQVCKEFEDAFGITWNETVQAYPVNETLHTALQEQNATTTFSLGSSTDSEQVNISIPYAAFDLMTSYTLKTNQTRYFPLMRAGKPSQYTLGRTFLQEA